MIGSLREAVVLRPRLAFAAALYLSIKITFWKKILEDEGEGEVDAEREL